MSSTFNTSILCQSWVDLRPGKQRRRQWPFSSITALACNTVISVTVIIFVNIACRTSFQQKQQAMLEQNLNKPENGDLDML